MHGSLETSGCLEVSKLQDAWKSRNVRMLGSLETTRPSKLLRRCSYVRDGSFLITRQAISKLPCIPQLRDFQASGSFETSKHLAASRLPSIPQLRDFQASGIFETSMHPAASRLPSIRNLRDFQASRSFETSKHPDASKIRPPNLLRRAEYDNPGPGPSVTRPVRQRSTRFTGSAYHFVVPPIVTHLEKSHS